MKVNRKHLIDILQLVKPGLASREIVEQTASFVFYDGQIITYNETIGIRHKLASDLKELDGVAIQAKELYDLASKLSDEEINLTIEDSELIVSGKKSKAGIRLQEANIKDWLKEMGKPKDWDELPASFCNALNFCAFSTTRNLTEAALTCIYMKKSDAISSDNIRITHYDLGKKANLPEILLPVISIMSVIDYDPLEYCIDDGWIHFRNEQGTIYSCRRIETDYPVDKVFEYLKNIEGPSIKLPDNLIDVLSRAGIFSSKDSKISVDNRVRITLSDGMLTVRGEGSSGWFEETSRIRYKGDEIVFETNPDHLNAILQHTNEMVIGESALKFEGEHFQHMISGIANVN